MTHPFHLEDVLPDAAVGPIRLPNRRGGTSAQSMIVTMVADYTLRTRAWLPSATVVALLGEVGVTSANARTAISRLSRGGVLEGRRQGRNAFYRLTIPAALALAFGGREIATFPEEAESWDGRWTLVAFSVSKHGDTERHALRSRLRWMGYAPLYDGLWVSPHPLSAKATLALTDFDIQAMTIFRAGQVEFGGTTDRDPLQAWDLASIGEQYAAFIARWNPLLPRIRARAVDGSEAVRVRTEVMDSYRQFVVLDPRLPLGSMPGGWLRAEAREVFVGVYDGLAGRAREHVLETAEQVTDVPSEGIGTHTVGELRDGALITSLMPRTTSV